MSAKDSKQNNILKSQHHGGQNKGILTEGKYERMIQVEYEKPTKKSKKSHTLCNVLLWAQWESIFLKVALEQTKNLFSGTNHLSPVFTLVLYHVEQNRTPNFISEDELKSQLCSLLNG